MAFGSTFATESAYAQWKWRAWCQDVATGSRGATFVAVDHSGRFVGMVGAVSWEGTPIIMGMWTRPEWRNRGIGRKLLKRQLAWLDKYRRGRPVFLYVNPSQAGAERMYATMGFRFSGFEMPLGHDPPAVVRQMVRRPRSRLKPRRARGR